MKQAPDEVICKKMVHLWLYCVVLMNTTTELVVDNCTTKFVRMVDNRYLWSIGCIWFGSVIIKFIPRTTDVLYTESKQFMEHKLLSYISMYFMIPVILWQNFNVHYCLAGGQYLCYKICTYGQ